eukprot:jgi/Botrbrau1/14995/Bobra.0018s0095.1
MAPGRSGGESKWFLTLLEPTPPPILFRSFCAKRFPHQATYPFASGVLHAKTYIVPPSSSYLTYPSSMVSFVPRLTSSLPLYLTSHLSHGVLHAKTYLSSCDAPKPVQQRRPNTTSIQPMLFYKHIAAASSRVMLQSLSNQAIQRVAIFCIVSSLLHVSTHQESNHFVFSHALQLV